MINTMHELFASTFQHDNVLRWAREVGALKRLREIHPADMCLALTNCAMGDETIIALGFIVYANSINGKFVKHTPLRNHRLRAGKYTVTVENAEFKVRKSFRVEIRPNQTTTLLKQFR